MNINSWQSGLTTHSLFLNHSAPIYTFYEQAVLLLGATALSTQESRDILKSVHPWMSEVQKDLSSYTIAPFSSLLAPEREFSSEEWAEILSRNKFPENAKLTILGGNADVDRAAELEILLSTRLRDVNIVNMAGKLKLVDSAHEIFKSNRLFAIDSGLNHIARLFGTDVTSYWGPTNPNRFLKPMSGIDEEVHYKPPYCSPCVHLIDSPPCAGNNICMKNHLSMSQSCLDGWLIKGTRS